MKRLSLLTTVCLFWAGSACSDDGVPVSAVDEGGPTGNDSGANTSAAPPLLTSGTPQSGGDEGTSASSASGGSTGAPGATAGTTAGTGTFTGTGVGTSTGPGTGTGTFTGTGTSTGTGGGTGTTGETTDPTGPVDCACVGDSYCDWPDDECGAGLPGTCQPIPAICPAIFDPACGCDGLTYSNSCTAHGAGVDVDFIGEC